MRITTLTAATVLGLGALVGTPRAASADSITVYHAPAYAHTTVHTYHYAPVRTHVRYYSRPVYTNYYTGTRQFHTWPTVTREVYDYTPGPTRIVSYEVYDSAPPTTRIVSHEIYSVYR